MKYSTNESLLGIDIGSVTVSLVQMDLTGEIVASAYIFHKGQIRECLRDASALFDMKSVKQIIACSSPFFDPDKVTLCNQQVAVIRASKQLYKHARSLLLVGAEKFMVIRFDQDGQFESVRSNSSCAAGTGSFLDQQAIRLNLSGIEELCEEALQNKDPVPEIASRCSVFAKTDLIHAQQRGYSLASICDSLCKGLATNIIDTLFNQEAPVFPLFMAGGVSKNKAVIRHLESLLNTRIAVSEHSHLIGAVGACYYGIQETLPEKDIRITTLDQLLLPENQDKVYFYLPLDHASLQTHSISPEYPDSVNNESWVFRSPGSTSSSEVTVDLYIHLEKNHEYEVYLGTDIGSTSTKAVLTDFNNDVVAGFYTYTSGKPVESVQLIFEAIDDLVARKDIRLSFRGAGTTGSGRKFIGRIIHADLIVDEITAHARAAFSLNPETDTIIEIGGQDSKFTLMHDGMVTFSQMNAVCAAGTGSFLEEQAKKLNCTLSDYEHASGVPAPLASDRCTVFMERDANQLLNQGYSVNEILATILHSVTENYLKKVAVEGSIGNKICFQGATAKNKSLVAAFEQKLGKKIFVSPYCHLTGALGVALLLGEEKPAGTSFRGLSLYKEVVDIRSEICTLCTNRCHISLTTINGEQEAYGFLCGRDYETKKHVPVDSTVFNLMEQRKKLFHSTRVKTQGGIVIGLPASLHLFDELPFWKRFFENLQVKTLTSENFSDPVSTGKRIAGAEFCNPVDSVYGHVTWLAEKADYIFFPVSFQSRNKNGYSEGNFCYYTQYSASLVFTQSDKRVSEKLLSPMLDFSKGNGTVIRKLSECLQPVLGSADPVKVRRAFEEALTFVDKQKKQLLTLSRLEFQKEKGISVVLLGRPYVVLSKAMNKGIPDIFARLGIGTFFQDMITRDAVPPEETELLLRKIPWYYAASILETARTAATTKNLYPVLITAFKCAPDSFIIEYFKKVLEKYHKPYLILQIDEHDSNTGYETRIEAAIRSFRNHATLNRKAEVPPFQLLPHLETVIDGKTLLFPNWDNLVAPLLVANLKREGIDARLMQSSEMTIKKSMAYNTGQCLPVNIITQEFIDYVNQHNLKPADTMLWGTKCYVTCNLRLYPFHVKNLLEDYGHGFENASVYYGDLTHLEIGMNTGYYAYFAYLLGGLIRKTGCRIRPYEIVKGRTDEIIKKSIDILEIAFLGKMTMDKAVAEVVGLFDTIEKVEMKRPRIAIFGDLYVRDNDIMNHQLIHDIEENGGEVITTPYSDLVKITIENVIRRAMVRGDYVKTGLYRVMMSAIKLFEDRYYKYFKKYLGNKPVVDPLRLEKNLKKFNITPYHSGESYENILKIFYILENYPDISLFVQTNPAFCCPALVTEAMAREIKRVTGIPVLTLTYDGTGGNKNDLVVAYLSSEKA